MLNDNTSTRFMTYSKFCFLLFVLLYSCSLKGQSNPDTLINKDAIFELKGDTLFASTGLKIFVGQKLIVGKAAGNEGLFRSIISKKAAIVPSIWGQDKRYENAIENIVDSKRNKQKVKDSLTSGKVLTIKRIILSKTGKPHFYMVRLLSDTDEYNCDIRLSLILNELLFQ